MSEGNRLLGEVVCVQHGMLCGYDPERGARTGGVEAFVCPICEWVKEQKETQIPRTCLTSLKLLRSHSSPPSSEDTAS